MANSRKKRSGWGGNELFSSPKFRTPPGREPTGRPNKTGWVLWGGGGGGRVPLVLVICPDADPLYLFGAGGGGGGGPRLIWTGPGYSPSKTRGPAPAPRDGQILGGAPRTFRFFHPPNASGWYTKTEAPAFRPLGRRIFKAPNKKHGKKNASRGFPVCLFGFFFKPEKTPSVPSEQKGVGSIPGDPVAKPFGCKPARVGVFFNSFRKILPVANLRRT